MLIKEAKVSNEKLIDFIDLTTTKDSLLDLANCIFDVVGKTRGTPVTVVEGVFYPKDYDIDNRDFKIFGNNPTGTFNALESLSEGEKLTIKTNAHDYLTASFIQRTGEVHVYFGGTKGVIDAIVEALKPYTEKLVLDDADQ